MESYIKGGRFSDSEWSRILKGRFSDSEWSRILKAGGLVILNGVVY